MSSTDPATAAPSFEWLDFNLAFAIVPKGMLFHQIGIVRYCLFVLAVAAQLATVIITWQLWQVRVDPPNLPVLDLPAIPFGIVLVLSLVYCLIDPRRGCLTHAIVLGVASVFDQFRLQPQFLGILVLMFAVVSRHGAIVCRWFLVSVWLWAGIHKFVSPDWYAHAGAWLVMQTGLPVSKYHLPFAVSVAATEVVLGLLAIFWPRIAGVCCFPFHVGVGTFLIYIQWNYSVLPWNFSTAVVGAWVMWLVGSKSRPKWAWEKFVALFFLIYPIGFYFGVVDHVYASVLYSDCVPRGLITRLDGTLRPIEGWDPVHVPFPFERRLHRLFFERIAKPGEKLHIDDPRPLLDDQFFVMRENERAKQISAEEFFDSSSGDVKGVGIDSRRSLFILVRDGARLLKRSKNEMVYAVEFIPKYFDRRMLRLLSGLPNLEQIQLKDCNVTDEDLRFLSDLKCVSGIGLDNTATSDAGLRYLEPLSQLIRVDHDNTSITDQGLARLFQKIRGR